MTHYETLKIEKEAAADEIKRAYYKLVRQYNPERFPEEFRMVREAYNTLSDVTLREEYDYTLKKREELAADLNDEAVKQIEDAESELKRAHTGGAVKIAESLYQRYPNNFTVISLLVRAYSARGWNNKAEDLISSLASGDILKNSSDWKKYISMLESREISETEIFAKHIDGILSLSKSGADDIDMCAHVYYLYSVFSKKELSGLTLPEEFNTPDKLLRHIAALSRRGLKTIDEEGDSFIDSLLMPALGFKKPKDFDSDDIQRIQTVIEIARNSVGEEKLGKSKFKIIIDNLEHIAEDYYDEPDSRIEPIRVTNKIGRNDPCPCGSGKKYKKCCGR